MTAFSDAEVICRFMCAKPEVGAAHSLGWWVWNFREADWQPRTLDLDALWEVEQKLTHGEQINTYIAELLYMTMAPDTGRYDWRLIHANVAQKQSALANVIRGFKSDE